ncbi:MAG: nucleotidyltransferase family protein [Planctomycetota bacterium]
MKTLKDIKNALKRHEPEIRSRYGVKKIGIFGSYARNQQRPKSDLDVLIEFNKTPSLFEFMGLEEYLSGFLGVKVDLVLKRALKPFIGRQILREVVYL